MSSDDHLADKAQRLKQKSAARQRLEEKSRVRELTGKLDSTPPPHQPVTIHQGAEMSNPNQPKTKKIIAVIVLIAALGALFFPAIGVGFTMFYATLSIYAYFGIIGAFVVLALVAIGWAVMTLLRE